MKKITILTTGDFPYGGAPEAIVRNIALGISANHVDVEVVRHRGRIYESNNNINIKSSNYLYKKYSRIELMKIMQIFTSILYTPIFIAKLRKEDALLLYGFEYSYHILPIKLFCKIKKIKCYRFITDHYRESSIVPVWWKAPKLYFYQQQIKKIDKLLDGIIVLSKYLENQSIKNNADKSKILLVPHFTKIKEISINKKDLNKGFITIGFCGTIIIVNGVVDLIKSFNMLKYRYLNARLVIMGRVTSEVKQSLSDQNIDTERVEFTGFLNAFEVEAKLCECDILVNPRHSGFSADAGFPTKIGEYLATKNPVVTTKIGDLAEYFTDCQEVKFAEPNNPCSIHDSLCYLIENESEAVKIGERGYNWALNNLEYVKNSKKLIHFIKGGAQKGIPKDE